MARLNELGDLALGIAGGTVSVGPIYIDDGGEACWPNYHTVLYQCLSRTPPSLRSYDTITGAYHDVDPAGANFLRAGGGAWAAQLNLIVRTSWGLSLPSSRVADVSDRGEVVVTPDDQNHVYIYPFGATGWKQSIATGPLGQDATAGINVRLRDGILLYQVIGVGWVLYNTETLDWLEIAPRKDVVDYAVPLRVAGEIWLLERAAGRLSLRPYHSTDGYVLNSGVQYSPDAVAGKGNEILVGWATSQGEPFDSGETRVQDLSLPREDLNTDEPIDPIDPPIDPIDPPIDPIDPPEPDMPKHAAVILDGVLYEVKEGPHQDANKGQGPIISVQNVKDGTYLRVNQAGGVDWTSNTPGADEAFIAVPGAYVPRNLATLIQKAGPWEQ